MLALLKDSDARMSFAVIGIFLILISTFTSAFLLKVDLEEASSVLESAKLSEVDEAYLYAKADLARALNYAALRALRQAGKSPLINIADHAPDKRANGSLFYQYEVNIKRESYLPGELLEIEVTKASSAIAMDVKLLLIDSSNATVAAWNMSELSWGWLGSDIKTLNYPLPNNANGTWTAKIQGQDIQDTTYIGVILDQEGWIKKMAHHNFKGFLKANYANESYRRGDYAINVYPCEDWRAVKLKRIEMRLERALNAPDILSLKPRDKYEVYYEVSIPVTLCIKDLRSNELIYTQNTNVTTLVTSRYLLLKELCEEYEKRISGTRPLMIETTSAAMAYTWARGYLQFAKREPANIVNNTHLGLIVNAATLLDQGFVFNSADPVSIIDLVYNSYKNYKNKNASRQEALNNITLIEGKYKYEPQKEAYETGSREAEEQYGSFSINASSIAQAIYEQSNAKIKEIINAVYSSSISLVINRESAINIPSPSISYNSEEINEWRIKSQELVEEIPYSHPVLGGEKWKVLFQRAHSYKYYKLECETITNQDGKVETKCYTRLKQSQTLIDTRVDVVTVKFNCNYHSKYETSDDIASAHFQTTFEGKADPNLYDALEQYKASVNWESTRAGILEDRDSSSHEATVVGEIEPWVEAEANRALLEIKTRIASDVSAAINHRETPLPEDALEKAKGELLAKYDAKAAEYRDKPRYFAGEYKSAGAKAIYKAREWYVSEVRRQLSEVMDEAIEKIKLEQDSGFKKQGLSEDEIIDLKSIARSAAKLLKEELWFPLGLEMTARREGSGYDKWNESVMIAIDQTPNYLNPFEKYKPLFASESEAFYPLAVQNVAFFGSTSYTEKGLPLLPPKYWVMTANAWYIHVKGEYYEFKVLDANNEPHPHPLWGHEAQEWVRAKDSHIWDPVSEGYLGNNTRLKFEFRTGTFIFVPAGSQGVGDSMIWFDNERSPRAIEEGW